MVKESPIIIGLDPVSTNIKNIPFPAVTICNMNQVKKSFGENLTGRAEQIRDVMCEQGDSRNDESQPVEGNWSYIRQFLINSSQKCEEMLKDCKFGTKNIDCKLRRNFEKVLTDDGLCCTFNGIHPQLLFKQYDIEDIGQSENDVVNYITWTPEKGYDENSKLSHYPRQVPGAGTNMGLTLLLDADVSNYYCSSTSSYGFKILLHSPIETPKMANFAFSVATGHETKIVITPKISEASNLIRKIDIKKRQCIFENEANLSYYKIYSKKNCEMECSSKIMEEKCLCTLYYMPRNFNDNNTKICNRRQVNCYEEVLFNISYSLNDIMTCNDCLPACFEVNYGREISSAKLGTGEFLTEYPFRSKGYNNATYIRENLAIVHIYFLDSSYRGFTKNELIGFTEFLSNTGGLLGLFMGFSVISLIEIIYFISLRPICAAQKAKKTNERLRSMSIEGIFGPKIVKKKKQINLSIFGTINKKLMRCFESVKSMWNDEDDDENSVPYPYCN